MGEWRQYREFLPGEFIVVGGDTSTGAGDYSVCQFLSRTKLDVPLVYHSPKVSSEMTTAIVPVLGAIHDQTGIAPTVAYERNNGGVFEMERLSTLNRSGKYSLFKMPNLGRIEAPDAVKLGWDTNTATRPAMLLQLKEVIDKQAITIYDRPTIEEMFSFVTVQTSSSWKAQAESHAHDDLVMALAIAWQLYQLAHAITSQSREQARSIYQQRLNEPF